MFILQILQNHVEMFSVQMVGHVTTVAVYVRGSGLAWNVKVVLEFYIWLSGFFNFNVYIIILFKYEYDKFCMDYVYNQFIQFHLK